MGRVPGRPGAACGVALPRGLRQCSRLLPEADLHSCDQGPDRLHDENVSFERTCGADRPGDHAEQLRDMTLTLYGQVADYACAAGASSSRTRNSSSASAKWQYLTLVDEALTPDSSRFWPADKYQEGARAGELFFDKQFVRDYLETLDWNKTAPGPQLPADVIRHTSEKYAEALQAVDGLAPSPASRGEGRGEGSGSLARAALLSLPSLNHLSRAQSPAGPNRTFFRSCPSRWLRDVAAAR